MRCLYLASEAHLRGHGGGALYSRGIVAALEDVLGSDGVEVLRLPTWAADLAGAPRKAAALLRSLGRSLPSRFYYQAARGWPELIDEAICRQGTDLVFINTADILPVHRLIPEGIPAVLVAHNVEATLQRQHVDELARKAGRAGPLLRRALDRDCRKMEAMEREGAQAVRNVLAISTDDARHFRSLGPRMNVASLPPAFRYQRFERPSRQVSRPLQVGFLAKMSWWPNRQAAAWFVDEVLDRLPAGAVTAHFFGPGSESHPGHPALETHGVVPDLSMVWKRCDFMICPIQAGSGVNIKFVEPLFNGVPVLATSISARGLPPIEGEGVRYLDSAEEWRSFLTSAAAEEFAASRVAPPLRDLFSPGHQNRLLSAFLDTLS